MHSKRSTPRLLLLALLLAFGLIVGSVVGGRAATSAFAARGAATVTASPLATATGQATPTTLPDIAGVAAKVRPATVLVLNLVPGQASGVGLASPTPGGSGVPQGAGTGFIIDPSGVIVTNNHVVEGAQSLRVVLPPPDNRSFDAQLVGRDPQTDLAVIKIGASNLPMVPLGNSAALRPGDWVVAIGNALDLTGGPTVTQGVVSATGRDAQEPPTASAPNTAGPTLYDLIQTDAAINPGNSGGPLVDLQGQVVGINTLGSLQAQGIGFAISIDGAKPIIDQLRQGGTVTRAYLGIGGLSVTPPIAAQLGLQRTDGVVVQQLRPRRPGGGGGRAARRRDHRHRRGDGQGAARLATGADEPIKARAGGRRDARPGRGEPDHQGDTRHEAGGLTHEAATGRKKGCEHGI